MPYARITRDPVILGGVSEFGMHVRHARRQTGISQTRLEYVSGIDQTAISRLERGAAANFPLVRLVTLKLSLRGWLTLGGCPHEHECAWHIPAEDLPGGAVAPRGAPTGGLAAPRGALPRRWPLDD